MPKKAPKNAFYFFMMDFRESQRKKGINYGKLNEVADAAGPFWKDAPPPIRAKYDAIAKKEKQKNGTLNTKYTSYGEPLSEVERRDKELKAAEENELQDIKNIIRMITYHDNIRNEDFYIMDVNYFCMIGSSYLIGESTILRFNMQDGIRETYHEIINPGYIPIGYASDVKLGATELGLEQPDDSVPRSNYMQILANIIDYLKQKDRNAKVLPPIFTMPDKLLPVQDFIQHMCSRAGENESLFRVYRLDTLFFTLINAIKTQRDEGFPKESLALTQLNKDLFKYTPGIGCSHHEEADKSMQCTSSRVKRWAYTILDSCCPVAGVELQPGKHLPYDYDMDSILVYKEQKSGRQAPSVAGALNVSLCNSSMASDYNDYSSLNTTQDSVKRERKPHIPMRMPKTDYSQIIQPAPNLVESQFSRPLAGIGRGRGIGGSFNRLKLDEE